LTSSGASARFWKSFGHAGADDLERLSLLEGRVYSPQAQLDEATVVLEFYAIADDLVLFVVDRTTVRYRRLPGAVSSGRQD